MCVNEGKNGGRCCFSTVLQALLLHSTLPLLSVFADSQTTPRRSLPSCPDLHSHPHPFPTPPTEPSACILFRLLLLLLILVMLHTGKGGRALPLTLYLTQLGLNLAWTPLFFQQHWADAALVDSAGVLWRSSNQHGCGWLLCICTF